MWSNPSHPVWWCVKVVLVFGICFGVNVTLAENFSGDDWMRIIYGTFGFTSLDVASKLIKTKLKAMKADTEDEE